MPIVDHGVAERPEDDRGFAVRPLADRDGLAEQGGADDPQRRPGRPPRDPPNPLALPVAPTASNPLAGASFFVDPQSEPADAAESVPAHRRDRPSSRAPPGSGSSASARTASRTSRPRSRGTWPARPSSRRARCRCWPPTGSCTGCAGIASDSPADAASYHDFIEGFAQGIGSYRAVLFLEMDSIITMPCLSQHGQAVREHELPATRSTSSPRTARTW